MEKYLDDYICTLREQSTHPFMLHTHTHTPDTFRDTDTQTPVHTHDYMKQFLLNRNYLKRTIERNTCLVEVKFFSR